VEEPSTASTANPHISAIFTGDLVRAMRSSNTQL
jgi:hypothetical protein